MHDSENNNDSIQQEFSDLKNSKRIVNDFEKSVDISEFLKLSESAIRKHGINKITDVLNNLDIQTEIQSLNKENLVNFICDCVVVEFKSDIVKKDLFHRTKRGDVVLARKMAIILMKQFLSELNDTQIGNFFGRSRQVIFNTMEELKQMNPKNKQHALFLSKHNLISKKIESFIEQNK